MVVAVFVLAQDDEFSGKISEGNNFLSLQFCDIVEHLIFFYVESIFLHRLHDAGVVGDGCFLGLICFDVTVFRAVADVSTFDANLYLVFKAFYLHDFSL